MAVLAVLAACSGAAPAAGGRAAPTALVRSAGPAVGPDPRATSGAPTGDPCALLSDATVSAAVGGRVTASTGELAGGLGGRQCVWTADPGRATGVDAGGLPRTLAIELHTDDELSPDLRAQGVSAWTLLADSLATQTARSHVVGDLGDRAVFSDDHLYVVVDGEVLVLDNGAGLTFATLVGLARQAVATRRAEAAAPGHLGSTASVEPG